MIPSDTGHGAITLHQDKGGDMPMEECCATQNERPTQRHLLIVGGGSAAFSAAIKASELGARVTLINDGLPIGGTCVNVGCVPSKMLIRAADAHHRAAHPRFHGIDSRSRVADFRALMAQKQELVNTLRREKYLEVLAPLPDVTRVEGRARIVARDAVQVNGTTLRADRIVIATGARPRIPDIPGLAESGALTNESAFALETLPDSLLVLGGRYIALECAQLFARLGSRVTILQHSPRILPTETPDLTDALTRYLTDEGIQIVPNVSVERVSRNGPGVVLSATVQGIPRLFEATHLLVATGRSPNVEELGILQVGVDVDEHGFIKVDDTLETTVPGIYGAGDVIGSPMFVYTGAYEGALAAENALTGTGKARDYGALPWVIFTDPQVAGVGLDERQAAEKQVDAEAATLPLSHVPRALVGYDTRGFIKLIRDRRTDRLLGARILAPDGSELLMECALAIRYGVPVQELASMLHPYLTLSEGVKLAALTFTKDVSTLSCCAS